MNRLLGLSVLFLSVLGPLAASEAWDSLREFDSIEVQSGIHIEVFRGEFRVKKTSGSASRVEAFVKGGTLVLRLRPGFFFWNRWGTVAFDVSLPDLNQMVLSGGSQGRLGWKGDSEALTLKLSGGAELKGTWNGGPLEVDLSGGSQLSLEGRSHPLVLEANGGSRFLSSRFQALDADLSLSGGARAELDLAGIVNVDASGGSQVRYSGSPQLHQRTSGGAHVNSR